MAVFYAMTMRTLPCETKFCGEHDERQDYQLDQRLVIQEQLLFWYLSMAMDLYFASIEVIKLPIFGVSMEMYGYFKGLIIVHCLGE